MATDKESKVWTQRQLAKFSEAAASGYVPGLQNDDNPTSG